MAPTIPERLPGLRLSATHLLSACAYRAARLRWRPWRRALIGWFVRRYRIDLDEALEPDGSGYRDFNAFFTRALRPGARPPDPRPDVLLSPADGTLSGFGRVEAGTLLQAKGIRYPLAALLGGDPARARPFAEAAWLTVYLSPRDYHRVHMPLSARLTEMIYVPGRLRSVAARTARRVPGLYAANERVVSLFESAAGPLAVVLVGATLVGSIAQVWCGTVTPPRRRAPLRRCYPDAGAGVIELARGAEMGRFNMGSTVIVLLAGKRLAWEPGLRAGARVRVGQGLARIA